MNKYKFIDYLHHPKKVTKDQEAKLLEVVEDYPYFQTARTLVAKVKSSQKDDPSTKKFISTASMYVFDRAFLRKYISEDLFIIEPKEASQTRQKEAEAAPELPRKKKRTEPSQDIQKRSNASSQGKQQDDTKASMPTSTPDKAKQKAEGPKVDTRKVEKAPSSKLTTPSSKQPQSADKKQTNQQSKAPETKDQAASTETSTPSVPVLPTNSSLDKLIEEVYQDMADLRKSKARFIEWQEKNDMEEAVEKAMAAASQEIKPKAPETTAEKENKPVVEEKQTEKAETESVAGAGESSKTEKKEETPPSATTSKEKEVSKTKTTKAVKPEPKEPAKKTTSSRAKKPAEPAKKTTATKKKTTTSSTAKKAASKSSTAAKTTTSKTTSKASAKSKSTTASTSKKKTATPKKSTTSKADTKKEEKKSTTSKETTKKSTSTTAKGKGETKKPVATASNEKQEKEEIIDKFIETQPTISKPAAEDNTPKDDLSKKSTRFHADIASEYLAEIYIEQGKKQRAIEIYENLCLKFPEKKSYFAGLIEKLKKE